jgi:nicotinamide riboside transporter PnuC
MADIIGWIGMIFYTLGIIFIAQKKYLGWWLALVGNIIYLGVGFMINMTSIIGINIIATGCSIYGLYKWRKQ